MVGAGVEAEEESVQKVGRVPAVKQYLVSASSDLKTGKKGIR